jgi:hypothetical protein
MCRGPLGLDLGAIVIDFTLITLSPCLPITSPTDFAALGNGHSTIYRTSISAIETEVMLVNCTDKDLPSWSTERAANTASTMQDICICS